jgi:hypothetical protein
MKKTKKKWMADQCGKKTKWGPNGVGDFDGKTSVSIPNPFRKPEMKGDHPVFMIAPI